MNFWEKKIAMITGGSSGLGLHIAREFSRQGALPVLVARDRQNLEQAQNILAKENLKSDYMVADLADADQAKQAVEEIIKRHGTLDCLVNNVGKSIRTRLVESTPQMYEDLIQANLMTAVNCSLAAIPYLSESSGHLVNIGSLSSKFAWPHVGPYTVGKFALAGFNHQLRIELPRNIHVMLVCPGPIQRADAGQRYEDQTESLPDSAKQPGAGVKLKGLCPEKLAAKILKGCRQRKLEIMLPFKSRFLNWVNAVSPSLGDWIIRRYKS